MIRSVKKRRLLLKFLIASEALFAAAPSLEQTVTYDHKIQFWINHTWYYVHATDIRCPAHQYFEQYQKKINDIDNKQTKIILEMTAAKYYNIPNTGDFTVAFDNRMAELQKATDDRYAAELQCPTYQERLKNAQNVLDYLSLLKQQLNDLYNEAYRGQFEKKLLDISKSFMGMVTGTGSLPTFPEGSFSGIAEQDGEHIVSNYTENHFGQGAPEPNVTNLQNYLNAHNIPSTASR